MPGSSLDAGAASRPVALSCAIASPHALATQAGVRSVQGGGNAVDAAISGALALSVVYPHNTSLGGDLFALLRTPDGRIVCVNASGPAGRLTDVDAVRGRRGGAPASSMPERGMDTVTLPGAVAGLGVLADLGAALPWRDHFDDAIAMAAEGVPVARSLAASIHEHAAVLRADPGLAELFAPAGRPISGGDTLRQPALARTLRLLAEDGAGGFYTGESGSALREGLERMGSAIGREDFATYAPRIEEPLSRRFRELCVWTSGPNSQGFALLEILQAVELLGLEDPFGEDAGALSELFVRASSDRDRVLADPERAEVPVEELLAQERWKTVQQPRDAGDGYRRGRRSRVGPGRRADGRPDGDTVAIVAADSEGRAVSLIQSLYYAFGAGILHRESGIALHNRGALFSLDPTSPNVLAPGKRPAHTLMPVMVTADDRLRWVAGTRGGKGQPQIHAQVLLRARSGSEPERAVSDPRWIVEGGSHATAGTTEPGACAFVEEGVPAAARAAIALRLPVVEMGRLDELVGHAHLIEIGDDGTFAHGSDPRSDGASTVAQS